MTCLQRASEAWNGLDPGESLDIKEEYFKMCIHCRFMWSSLFEPSAMSDLTINEALAKFPCMKQD